MDLREEFKKETGLRIIIEDNNGNSFYTEDYVKWLEEKLSKKLSISDAKRNKSSSKRRLKDKENTTYSIWAKKLRDL